MQNLYLHQNLNDFCFSKKSEIDELKKQVAELKALLKK